MENFNLILMINNMIKFEELPVLALSCKEI